LVKDVEVALSFGLMNDTLLLQQIIQNMATYWIALKFINEQPLGR
jgi:hypothetical protein